MLGINIDYNKRIFGYDLIRAFAIFCVVHRHSHHLLNGTILESFPWFNLPHGVDIFFVLSGFLIGYSFIVSANKSDGKLGFEKSLNFWKRSALRILPNYYLILALNYFLVNANILPGTTEDFGIGLFITFTQNLFYPFYNFFWESWSLAVQEWFYLLFPVLLMIYSRFFKIKYGVILFSFLFILLSIFYRYSISNIEYDNFWWDVNFRKVVVSRIDSIFYGVLAAWLRYYLPKFWNKYAFHLLIVGIGMHFILNAIPKTPNTLYLNVIYLSLIPLAIALCFPAFDKIKNVKTLLGKLITALSVLSYGIYLFNLLIIQIVDKHYSELLSNHATGRYILFWLITITCSYLLYILYENPISSHGNKLLHTTKMMYKKVREKNN